MNVRRLGDADILDRCARSLDEMATGHAAQQRLVVAQAVAHIGQVDDGADAGVGQDGELGSRGGSVCADGKLAGGIVQGRKAPAVQGRRGLV